MSRTVRSYRDGKGRDGQQDFRTTVARDNRATGLRDHRGERQAARTSLRMGEDTALSGKHRRYSRRYGTYLL